ncbi:hypothetical protein JAAARDRAFT_204615 [Jaapia argillacea MUCL 33604]|uniref:ABC transporter domain-containing protein n=1 Tax=Jaapia argillacea MUCL 33604 TaxID=933084 RepID=A0A067QDZ1_9AGAM|nr:hypothetical protein JAAARDRAFT_204615 [Jaapia argillacea MUCL 33604]
MSALLELRSISCPRPEGAPIFHDISFSLNEGDILILRGRSGVGKSTLLKCIAHLNVYRGEIFYRGKAAKSYGIPAYRTHVLYVPQRPSLLPGTPRDFLASVAKFGSRRSKSKDQRAAKKGENSSDFDISECVDVGKSWGVEEELWDRNWANLSGGEAQRVVLAIAVGLDAAEVLLLDEPTSALDPVSSKSVEERLTSELRDPHSTLKGIIWITHSEEQGARVGTRFTEITPEGVRENRAATEV